MHVEMGRHNGISKKSFSWVAQRWGNKGSRTRRGILQRTQTGRDCEVRGEWFETYVDVSYMSVL